MPQPLSATLGFPKRATHDRLKNYRLPPVFLAIRKHSPLFVHCDRHCDIEPNPTLRGHRYYAFVRSKAYCITSAESGSFGAV